MAERVVLGSVQGSAARPYNISFVFSEGMFQCGCPAWTRHAPRKDCKHVNLFWNAVVKGQYRPDVSLAEWDPMASMVLQALPRSHAAVLNGRMKVDLE